MVNWLFNVTINDISIIYVTVHRCAGGLKRLDLQSGSQRHRHFVGSLTCPSKHRLGANLLQRLFLETAPFSSLGIRRTHSRLNPRGWVNPRGLSEWDWLFNVTGYDISDIYVTAHRCAGGLKKKLNLRSGSQRHRYFVGFFNVPVQTSTRHHPLYTVIPRNCPI